MSENNNERYLENVLVSFCSKMLSSVPVGEIGDVYQTVMDTVEEILLRQALLKCEGNQVSVARLLGVHRNTIRRKIKQHNLLD